MARALLLLAAACAVGVVCGAAPGGALKASCTTLRRALLAERTRCSKSYFEHFTKNATTTRNDSVTANNTTTTNKACTTLEDYEKSFLDSIANLTPCFEIYSQDMNYTASVQEAVKTRIEIMREFEQVDLRDEHPQALKGLLAAAVRGTRKDEDIALPTFDPARSDSGAGSWCTKIEALSKQEGAPKQQDRISKCMVDAMKKTCEQFALFIQTRAQILNSIFAKISRSRESNQNKEKPSGMGRGAWVGVGVGAGAGALALAAGAALAARQALRARRPRNDLHVVAYDANQTKLTTTQ